MPIVSAWTYVLSCTTEECLDDSIEQVNVQIAIKIENCLWIKGGMDGEI